MPKINLAQEALRNQMIGRRRRMMYTVSTVILVLIGGTYALLFLLTTQAETKVQDMENEVAQLQTQLQSREDDVHEVVLFRERLDNLKAILASHIRWSRIMEELERVATPDSSYASLKGDVESHTIVADIRVPTIDAAADFLASHQHQKDTNPTYFTDVLATALRAATDISGTAAPGYRLGVTMKTRPEAFFSVNEGLQIPAAAAGAATAPTGPSSPTR